MRFRYLLLILAVSTGCVIARPVPEEDEVPEVAPDAAVPLWEQRSFAWEVVQPATGHRFYLAGSVHSGKPGQYLMPPAMDRAFKASDVLVVEVDPQTLTEADVTKMMRRMGWLPHGETLSGQLSRETLALLPGGLEQAGIDRDNAEKLRPWLLTLILGRAQIERAGYSPDYGVDAVLLDKARGRKLIVSVETLEEQLTVFASLSRHLQDLMLREQLLYASPAAAVGELERMAAAWRTGSLDAMAAVTLSRADDPVYRPLYERLFDERNERIAERLVTLFDKQGTHFVLVGAGHLVGETGIPTLLQEMGYSVRQLPREETRAQPHPERIAEPAPEAR